MNLDHAEQRFPDAVLALEAPNRERAASDGSVRHGSALTVATCRELFDAQLTSRQLDLAARWMQQQGRGYYTISSAGHEGNAAVAAVLRPTDPALLHYRSGAFYVQRASQVAGVDAVRDVLYGVAAAADEPIAGGRHKVFGRAELAVIPQTSTIASHLPRAVGVAFAIGRAQRLGLTTRWTADAIAVASVGDASMNHSTAAGAINSACLGVYEGLQVPLLLVCEDNGLGISVRTPSGWVKAAYGNRPGLRYVAADGCDLAAAYDAALDAAEWVRSERKPVLLHLSTVRLLAHAGSDVESGYRTPAEIAAGAARDPLMATARLLVESGAMTREQVVERYRRIRARVFEVAEEALHSRPLQTATQVVAPLASRHPERVAEAVQSSAYDHLDDAERVTVAQAINRTLGELLEQHPELLVFGEDVGRKGGVYGVTRGLQRRFGMARVFDTPLDEQTILGLALGAGVSGLLPVPEIQYLAYLHNAEDQLRGEAATEQFFSQGQFRNPMVVRIAAYAYQRGFGGHFHNDNSVAVLRDIPGVVVASPALPDDAGSMLRTCVEAARVDGSICVFLEPIALYHERDLHEDGDGLWLADYPEPPAHVPIGRGRVHGSGTDATIVTFGNGLRLSLQAAMALEREGIGVRVLDLRWLAPLPVEDLLHEAATTGLVLIVDETRHTGGVGEGVVTALIEAGYDDRIARVSGLDSLVPLGDAANLVLVQRAEIESAVRRLVAQ
jgi:2-oxoisovalerate dehydrogenase E1 component